MTIEDEALEYLHQEFFKMKPFDLPEGVEPPKLTEEDWQRMPEGVKKQMIDLIIGFTPSSNPILEKLRVRRKMKDLELGMYVRTLI